MNFHQTVAPSPSVATLSLRTNRVPRPPMAVWSAMTWGGASTTTTPPQRNLYSVFCWRSCLYSEGGYETDVSGRAPTVGDTSDDEAACGEMDEAGASVPGSVEVSMSLNSWSRKTSDKVETTGLGEVGTGSGAGCDSGSTADVDGIGDGSALS